jgi:tetratricopeptide (TPR) repeat protein
MFTIKKILILSLALLQNANTSAFTFPNHITNNIATRTAGNSQHHAGIKSRFFSSNNDSDSEPVPSPQPINFREAEVLGLRLMQEGQHEEALKVFQKGLKLPGSRKDIIRTQTLSGPSPVGGSSGGTEGKIVLKLDEFELQAAHYNIACAYARLNQVVESCASLEQAFKVGFDNYATVRSDPDLDTVHGSDEFSNLMERFDSKKGFFGLFK